MFAGTARLPGSPPRAGPCQQPDWRAGDRAEHTVLRDEELQGRMEACWAHEVRQVAEVMEEREEIQGHPGVSDALKQQEQAWPWMHIARGEISIDLE